MWDDPMSAAGDILAGIGKWVGDTADRWHAMSVEAEMLNNQMHIASELEWANDLTRQRMSDELFLQNSPIYVPVSYDSTPNPMVLGYLAIFGIVAAAVGFCAFCYLFGKG